MSEATMPQAIQDPAVGLKMIPTPASDYAGQVDLLYFTLLTLSGLLVATLVGLIVWFGLRYHQGRDGERAEPIDERRSRRIEAGFALFLGTLFMGLFVWAGWLYVGLYQQTEADLTVNVIGKQWMWKAQHPDGTREINSLHVPEDQVVRLRLTSQDVIHSFSLPALRLKRDAVPGHYTEAYFRATEPGEYRMFCAEYCGTEHSRMRGKLVVLSQDDYRDWLRGTDTGADPVAAGKALFQEQGCAGCHEGDTGVPAPDLKGLYGSQVSLADGDTVTADENYLRTAITDPQEHVVAGYQPVMPSFAGQLSEEEILQLIAYIKSLSAQGQGQASGDRP